MVKCCIVAYLMLPFRVVKKNGFINQLNYYLLFSSGDDGDNVDDNDDAGSEDFAG